MFKTFWHDYLVTILLEDNPACIVVEEGLGVVQGEGEHAQREHVCTRGEFHSIRIVPVFGCKKIEICEVISCLIIKVASVLSFNIHITFRWL